LESAHGESAAGLTETQLQQNSTSQKNPRYESLQKGWRSEGRFGLFRQYRMFNISAPFIRRHKGMSMKKTLFSALGLAVALAFSAPMIGSADAATVTTKTVVTHHAHHHVVRKVVVHRHRHHHHHHHAKHVVVKKVVKKG